MRVLRQKCFQGRLCLRKDGPKTGVALGQGLADGEHRGSLAKVVDLQHSPAAAATRRTAVVVPLDGYPNFVGMRLQRGCDGRAQIVMVATRKIAARRRMQRISASATRALGTARSSLPSRLHSSFLSDWSGKCFPEFPIREVSLFKRRIMSHATGQFLPG